ncbi:hypothetical protein POPTR_006G171212v4 [Populus trichocarpa]|uniref:Uncharacterized protein n=1 Tax=Populus trichocarpa TaxID=3694 RepID=A0ACC0SUT0_POPTR|nr:hypothetical protein POPTR_006G171212v4 [Populus trichocarpa]
MRRYGYKDEYKTIFTTKISDKSSYYPVSSSSSGRSLDHGAACLWALVEGDGCGLLPSFGGCGGDRRSRGSVEMGGAGSRLFSRLLWLRGKPGAEGEDGGRIGAAAGVRPLLRSTVKNMGLWPLKLRWRQGERSVAGWKENVAAASWLLAETNERLRGKKRNRGNRVDGGAGTAELLGEGEFERRRGRRTGPAAEKRRKWGRRLEWEEEGAGTGWRGKTQNVGGGSS